MPADCKGLSVPIEIPFANLELSGSGSPQDASREEKSSRLTPTSIVYWSRLGFAIIAAAVYNLIGLSLHGNWGLELGTMSAIGLGIAFYAGSVYFYRFVLGYEDADLKGPRKLVTTGMGAYIIWLLFGIILINTLLFARA